MLTDHPRDFVHATIVEAIISQFHQTDSVTMPESPYNVYGVRGVVDVARYAPGPVRGCRADFVEVETRLSDVNAIIRKVRERALVFPQYLRASRQLEVGPVTSWLALLATQDNAEIVLEYRETFSALFGNGIREPGPDGARYGLCFVDPLAFKGLRAIGLLRLQQEGILADTLFDLCRYRDKPDFERELLAWRRGERVLDVMGAR